VTIFAGCFGLSEGNIGSEVTKELNEVFENKFNSKSFLKFSTDNCHICSLDIGAYLVQPSILADKSTILAGEPIIDSDKRSLSSDICSIEKTENLLKLSDVLKKSRGVFAGVKYDASQQNIYIFTDKNGIRPLYYCIYDGILTFSSNFQFICSLSWIPNDYDARSVMEHMSLGYCLGRRTTKSNIFRLDAAEIIHTTSSSSPSNHTYWDWVSDKTLNSDSGKQVSVLYNEFKRAVQLRADKSDDCYAFLSGGMDSRVITATLNELALEPITFNFATKNSQDGEFARLYAEKNSFNHHPLLLPTLKYQKWAKLVSNQISKLTKVKKARFVWSGDGGSVGLGGVYMDKDLIAPNLSNRELAKDFLAKQKVEILSGYFTHNFSNLNMGDLIDSIEEELNRIDAKGAKKLYLFLMKNDQKRHLDEHYETIHEHQVELQLPFFDALFIEKVLDNNLEGLLGHSLYAAFFDCFPLSYRNTPWQTYPGHKTCPIPYKPIENQWQNRDSLFNRWLDFKFYLKIPHDSFCFNVFKRGKTTLAMFLHLSGFKKLGYVIDTLVKISKF
jgi:asparagine synthase (glutamine-hydrolysing)